ncbi:LAMA5 [Branchiostoma lanceolatum]|uniref:LAMA5 protein n=1 Tax=Branchiostoma lanceolatum TaxID=7740 RepID=A0A8K0EGU1_BRALA|nr:LAMA5 [Branchiostoma lanceolatum]
MFAFRKLLSTRNTEQRAVGTTVPYPSPSMSARRSRPRAVTGVLAVLLAAACAPLPRGTATAVPGTVDPVVNVAQGKPVRANVTCGDPSEDFYPHSDSVKRPPDRQLQICDASDPVLSHNASLMTDGNSSTWWQSTSLQQLMFAGNGLGHRAEVFITLDLGETYHPENITVLMGDTKRPGRLAVMRSDDGLTFESWLYLVTNGNRDCRRFGVAEQPEPDNPESVVCREYPQLGVEQLYSERITVPLSEVPPSFSDEAVLRWQAVRHLQLRFYDMDLVLGIFEDQFHHYAVSEVSVMAGCECNGLGNGCDISDDSGQYECICGGNSQGPHCGECLPLYNQYPYQPGQPCQACNCNNHSEACVYNETVGDANLSLASDGRFHGGGVCLRCRDNTTGTNCEQCDALFYMNPGVPHQSSSACLPCGCDLIGSSGLQCNMTSGQCPCKPGVGGRMCDVCLPGYYNLTSGGCTPCPCYPLPLHTPCHVDQGGQVTCNCTQGHEGEQCERCAEFYWGDPVSGTACAECDCSGNSDRCDNVTGACISCQGNTTGFNCDRCADGFYGDAIFGNCSACACDEAGSVNLTCDHTSGLCHCRPGVDTSTRRCSRCMENYYGFDTPDGDGTDSQPGCSPCHCNVLGSTSMQCGEGGNCSCHAGVEGTKCDVCTEGSYGLPDMPCQACECDLVGTNFDPYLPTTTQSALGQTTVLGLTTSQDATEETTTQGALGGTTPIQGITVDTTSQAETTDIATTTNAATTNVTSSATTSEPGTTNITTTLTETTNIATTVATTNGTTSATDGSLGTTNVTTEFAGSTDVATDAAILNNTTVLAETTDIATTVAASNATTIAATNSTTVAATNSTTVAATNATTVTTTNATTDGLQTTNVTTEQTDTTETATAATTTNDTFDVFVTTEVVTTVNDTAVTENVTTAAPTDGATAVSTNDTETNATDSGTGRLVEEGFQARQRRQLPATPADNTQQSTTVSSPLDTTATPPVGSTPAPGATIFTGSHTCQRTTGQCRCKPGVGGRSCNVCLPMFHGFGPDGCSECSACEQTLHRFLAVTETDWDRHWGMAEEVDTLQTLDGPLQDISVAVETVQQDLNESALDLGDLNGTVINLIGALPELNRTAESLRNQVSLLFLVASQLLNSSSAEYMRLEQLRRTAQDMLSNATAANRTAFMDIRQLSENRASAGTMLLQAEQVLGNLTVVSFDDLGQQSQAVLAMAANASLAALDLDTTVNAEVQEAAAVNDSLTTAQTLLSSVISSKDSIKLTADLVLTAAEDVGQQLTTANTSRQRVAVLIDETASLLSGGAAALQAAELILGNATQDFEQAETLLNGENGWTATAVEVNSSSSQTAAQLTALTAAVQNAEFHAADLTAQADAVDSVFQPAQLQGQAAVNAIRGYEEVALLLNESVSIATEVNATVQNLTDYIQSVSIATLEGRANQSLAASLELQEEVDGRNMSTAGLLQEVRSANASLSAAQTEWGNVTDQLQQLEEELQGAEAAAQEDDITTSLEEGFLLVERAANQSTAAEADIAGVSSGVEGVRGQLVVIQQSSDNVTTIVADLEQTGMSRD